MSLSVAVIDSLQRIIAHKDSLLAAALAHRETVTVAVHDVRVASPALGIRAQLMVAGIAVLGGAVVQVVFRSRDERRAEREAARTDEEIRNQVAIGVGSICMRLRPIHDKILRNEPVHRGEIVEMTRLARFFETVMPMALKLRDRVRATQAYLWFSAVQWLPEDLELLAGELRGYRERPEPRPLDAELARLWEELAPELRTRGEVALARIARILAGERTLGPVLDIYDPGGNKPLVPILSERGAAQPAPGVDCPPVAGSRTGGSSSGSVWRDESGNLRINSAEDASCAWAGACGAGHDRS